jgi:hypothetical protein
MEPDYKVFQLKYQPDRIFSGSLDKYAFVSISLWLIPCCEVTHGNKVKVLDREQRGSGCWWR